MKYWMGKTRSEKIEPMGVGNGWMRKLECGSCCPDAPPEMTADERSDSVTEVSTTAHVFFATA